jgi:hypothetical protein
VEMAYRIRHGSLLLPGAKDRHGLDSASCAQGSESVASRALRHGITLVAGLMGPYEREAWGLNDRSCAGLSDPVRSASKVKRPIPGRPNALARGAIGLPASREEAAMGKTMDEATTDKAVPHRQRRGTTWSSS